MVIVQISSTERPMPDDECTGQINEDNSLDQRQCFMMAR